MDVWVCHSWRISSWIPKRGYLNQSMVSITVNRTFSFTYNPYVSCRDRWWSHRQCQSLSHQCPMKRAYWRIPTLSRRAHLQRERIVEEHCWSLARTINYPWIHWHETKLCVSLRTIREIHFFPSNHRWCHSWRRAIRLKQWVNLVRDVRTTGEHSQHT